MGATLGVVSDSIPLRNYNKAIHVMQRATSVPKNTEISYHDQVHFINYAISSVDLFLQSLPSVDSEVNQTMLLVLNLSQLKSCGIRLRERLSQVKPVLPMTRQE